MKTSIMSYVAASALALAAGAAPVVSEIALLEGERWWGGAGGDGQNQPYGAADGRRIDLRSHGHTSSPLLVSSCGRYVWSEKPFGYEFRGGMLVLDSDVEKIEPVVAGKTLKDAYLAAAGTVGAESVAKEPGVVCIFPMQKKESPTSIRIVEIYRNEESYKTHLDTPHFRAYKEGTPHMIKSLKLVPMQPLDERGMKMIFKKEYDK